MRAVLDTNLVISRYLSPLGKPARIFELWEQNVFELVASEPILSEYRRVLGYGRLRVLHGMTDAQIIEVVNYFRAFSTVVEPTDTLDVVKDDPSDNMFLECAVAGGAEYVVSGDPHLQRVGEYEGIQILSPAAFLALLEQERA